MRASCCRFSLAFDPDGNLVIGEESAGGIRLIAPDGTVSTLFGGKLSGSVEPGSYPAPISIYAVEAYHSGGFLVLDYYAGMLWRIAPDSSAAVVAGISSGIGSSDGPGASARFNGPTGAALDSSGNLYIADTQNNTIRKMTPNGVVSTPAGSPGTIGSSDGTGRAAQFQSPSGVATDAAGNVYVRRHGE